MSESTVLEELQGLVKLPPKQGEAPSAFCERLARKANSIADDDWEALGADTQDWVNSALKALERKKHVPLVPGIEKLFPDAQEQAAPQEKGARSSKKEKAPSKAGAERTPLFSKTDIITVLIEGNPYRPNTHSARWFGNYSSGMTVAEAIAAGTPRHHIRWDLKQANISIGP